MSNLKEAVNKDGSSASVVAKIVRYENCCKNHGARAGKYATDGCMEFMAKITDPLACDACGCHRNFHQKKVVEDGDRGDSEVRYEDCCKNHAIRLGEYSSKDGCLEFMANEGGGEAGGSRAELTCDACGCHRNFHNRKEEKERVVRKRSPPASYGGGSSAYDSDHYYD